MNYGKLTAGTTKTAIDTAKPSEKGEIITYLSRMGDVLEYPFKANHQIVVLVACVYVFGYRKHTHIIFTKIVYKHCGLRSVPSESGQVFNDYRVNAFILNGGVYFIYPLTVKMHSADVVIGRLTYNGAVIVCRIFPQYILLIGK